MAYRYLIFYYFFIYLAFVDCLRVTCQGGETNVDFLMKRLVYRGI